VGFIPASLLGLSVNPNPSVILSEANDPRPGKAELSGFLYPPLAFRVLPYILFLGLLGAVSQIVWLIVFGVNEQQWKEQARAAGTGA
jgi:hypothetical protein